MVGKGSLSADWLFVSLLAKAGSALVLTADIDDIDRPTAKAVSSSARRWERRNDEN